MKAADVPRFVKEVNYVSQVLQHYLDTGVCVIERDYTSRERDLSPKPSLRAFVRAVAKDLKRPFLVAQTTTYFAWTTGGRDKKSTPVQTPTALTIPKTIGLSSVYSGLLLASPEPSNDRWAQNGLPLWRHDTKTTVTFFFQGEGLQAFHNFIEQCRTNPVFRIALKIT